jgi:hypothetical protein
VDVALRHAEGEVLIIAHELLQELPYCASSRRALEA